MARHVFRVICETLRRDHLFLAIFPYARLSMHTTATFAAARRHRMRHTYAEPSHLPTSVPAVQRQTPRDSVCAATLSRMSSDTKLNVSYGPFLLLHSSSIPTACFAQRLNLFRAADYRPTTALVRHYSADGKKMLERKDSKKNVGIIRKCLPHGKNVQFAARRCRVTALQIESNYCHAHTLLKIGIKTNFG